MDMLTPVGSLDAWLHGPTAVPEEVSRSAFSSRASIEPSNLSTSEPIPIPCLPNPMGTRGAAPPRDPVVDADSKPAWTERWRLIDEILDSYSSDSRTHPCLPGEGTVRSGRRLKAPPAIGDCSSGEVVLSTPHGLRQHWMEATDVAVQATSAPLPLLSTHQTSPGSLLFLASLCRALSSPADEAGTLARPLKAPPAHETQCMATAATAAPAPRLPSSSSPSVAVVVSCGCNDHSVCARAVVLRNGCGQAAACGGLCGAGGLIGRAAAVPAAVAATVAARRVPASAFCSTKRGLYEGTVRDGSVRNTWQYTYCCTAVG